jgi:hypothetical protein
LREKLFELLLVCEKKTCPASMGKNGTSSINFRNVSHKSAEEDAKAQREKGIL